MANVAHPKQNAAMSHGRLAGLTNPPVRGDGGAAWRSVASEAGRGTRRAGRVETDEEGERRSGDRAVGVDSRRTTTGTPSRVFHRDRCRAASLDARPAREVCASEIEGGRRRVRGYVRAQRASGTRISFERPAVLVPGRRARNLARAFISRPRSFPRGARAVPRAFGAT